MKHVLNQLVQLQELNFALAEHRATDPEARLKPLEESIAKLMEKLPEDVARLYNRIQRNNPLVVVPIMRGNCGGCGVAVSSGTANDIRAGKEIFTCQNCARFLFYEEGLPRQPQKPAGAKRPLGTGIGRFSDVNLMVPKLIGKTREEAIKELAQLMAAQGFVENADTLAELALRREAMVSTAVEHGLAFPHVRNVEGGSLTFALGMRSGGVKFDGDGLSKLVFFIVIPTAASAFYLRLLAGLVRTFSTADARSKMLKCDSPEVMWKTLTALTRQHIQ